MPGIPRTKRCERCKRRRIKCDEKWPTCTGCRLANVSCSGPPTEMKFVHNGRHRVTRDVATYHNHQQTTPMSTAKGPALVNLSSRNGSGGTSYNVLRLVPEPRSLPTTASERVSARLVAQFDKDPTIDLLKTVGYTSLLPCRVAESPALRDVLALFCSTWSNFRRGKTEDGLIDAMLYTKAIRSLRHAIEDPVQYATGETLAATMLLERFEILFDTERSYHHCIHGHGVYSILARKGPPKLTDELDVCLALESQGTVSNYCVATGVENFYLTPQWDLFLDQAMQLSSLMTNEQLWAYKMERLLNQWPGLCVKVHELCKDATSPALHVRALAVRDEIRTTAAEVQSLGEETMGTLQELGHLIEVTDHNWRTGSKYEFPAVFSQRCCVGYFSVAIILNRMLAEIDKLLGEFEPALEMEYKQLCHLIWKCYPFVRRVGNLAEVMFGPLLYLTYEGGNDEEKTWILDCLRRMDQYRKRLPTEDEPLESYILHTVRIIIGRCYLPEKRSSLKTAPLRKMSPTEVKRLCDDDSLK